MTRKDFQLIAATIAGLEVGAETKRYVARSFAEALRSTNPNFNADRFVTACTPEGKEARS
jgi:hypothetical protein